MNEPQSTPTDRRTQLDRLRGMTDIPATALQRRDTVRQRIQSILAQHGYRAVETPILESTELFLRKSGGERVAQMYAFRYREREIALRPEHTASILRMYVDSMQSEPLPLRLSYTGPVFRYEKPQAGRTRQFTEMGCELLGGAGPAADAEVIHLALEGLESVGIEGRLVLGHVGIVLDFLNRLPLRQRARDWLLWSMERLRKGQTIDLDADIQGLASGDRLSDLFDEMSETLQNVPPQQLEDWVLAVLNEVGVQTQGGARTPQEIVAGVIDKMSRNSDEEDVRRAFAFVRELAAIHGSPRTALPQVRDLAVRHNLASEPINQIEQILDLLRAYGYEEDRIELNLGLGRGLHYYTGMLFEIYAPGRHAAQLCGGGRYDDLAQMLGARQPLPACGFSYGLERIVESSAMSEQPPTGTILVAPDGSDALVRSIEVAERLRRDGEHVELDVRGRSVHANRRYAQRAGMARLVIVSADGSTLTESLRGGPGEKVIEAVSVPGKDANA